jgi:hypothetical protein
LDRKHVARAVDEGIQSGDSPRLLRIAFLSIGGKCIHRAMLFWVVPVGGARVAELVWVNSRAPLDICKI